MECSLCLELCEFENFTRYECCKAQACNICYTKWRNQTYECPFCRTERQRDQNTQISGFQAVISAPAPVPIVVPTNEEIRECTRKKLRYATYSFVGAFIFYYLIRNGGKF
jgi:hypothetical protein